MKEDLEKAIRALVEKASTTEHAMDAESFAQAVTHLAQAACSLGLVVYPTYPIPAGSTAPD